jgi:hypothetical protein
MLDAGSETIVQLAVSIRDIDLPVMNHNIEVNAM